MDNIMKSDYVKNAMRGEGLLLTAQILLSIIGGIANFFITFEGRCPHSMITLYMIVEIFTIIYYSNISTIL